MSNQLRTTTELTYRGVEVRLQSFSKSVVGRVHLLSAGPQSLYFQGNALGTVRQEGRCAPPPVCTGDEANSLAILRPTNPIPILLPTNSIPILRPTNSIPILRPTTPCSSHFTD